ncbi:glycosyltransferase [Geotoga petraea]|nr:glycosyltransferase [Geotoga petraea]
MYENIIEMIEKKDFEKALNEVEKIEDEKWEKYNLKGLVYFYKNDLEKSKKIFEKGLEIEPINSDLLFNYSHLLLALGEEMESWRYLMRMHEKDWAVYDILGDIEFKNRSKASAIKFYKKAYDLNQTEEMAKKLLEKRKIIKKNEKIAFFCLPGLETFIKPIAEELAYEYDVRLIVSKEEKEIKEGIEWANIIWIEWANELAIYITNKFNLTDKYVINRIHRYEVYSNHIKKINWNIIDKIITVSKHIKNNLIEINNDLTKKIKVINNGVNLDKFNFNKRFNGKNIGFVGYLNMRKNPMLLIQIMSRLNEKKYSLNIAGDFQDITLKEHLEYIINNDKVDLIKFEGWRENIIEFLSDKNYLISTSLNEGHPFNILEAMALGIKPIIYNYYGSKNQWPENLIFTTVEEAINIILEDNYDSIFYRKWVEDNYTFEKMIFQIEKIVLKKDYIEKNIKHFKFIKIESSIKEFLKGETFSNSLQINFSGKKPLISREELLKDVSKDKKVIHFGFADHLELIDDKRKNNIWLHDKLVESSNKCVGIDINKEAVEYISENLKIGDVYCLDINKDELPEEIRNEKWDYLILGELIEHVGNPVEFLEHIRIKFKNICNKILLTTPNAFRSINNYFLQKDIEIINSDHRFWFTPYTLMKVLTDAGYDADSVFFTENYQNYTSNQIEVLENHPMWRNDLIMIAKF